jgi:NDP-sugar pyrophosphorylase family protein
VHHDLLAGIVSHIDLAERRGEFEAATAAEIDERSLIADNCTIKPGAQIINSVLGEGCYVDERARVENSVIWAHTRINAARRCRTPSSGAAVMSGARLRSARGRCSATRLL